MGVACLLERCKDGLLIRGELRVRSLQHEKLRAAQGVNSAACSWKTNPDTFAMEQRYVKFILAEAV